MENIGIGEWIVIGLSLVIALFFIIGSWMNNQISMKTVHWLKRGLSIFGEVGAGQFGAPSSTGIPFKIEAPSSGPVKTFIGNLNLERRENLPLWIFNILQGKRDTLLVKIESIPSPSDEIHAFHKSNLSQVEAARRGEKASFTPAVENADYHYFSRGQVEPILLNRVQQWIALHPGIFLQVSLQKKVPQLVFQVRLAPMLAADAEEFFRSLQHMIQ